MNNLMNNFKKKYYENKRLTDRLLIDLPIYFKKYCQDEKIYNEIEDKLIDLNICDCDAVHSGAKQRASSFRGDGGEAGGDSSLYYICEDCLNIKDRIYELILEVVVSMVAASGGENFSGDPNFNLLSYFMDESSRDINFESVYTTLNEKSMEMFDQIAFKLIEEFLKDKNGYCIIGGKAVDKWLNHSKYTDSENKLIETKDYDVVLHGTNDDAKKFCIDLYREKFLSFTKQINKDELCSYGIESIETRFDDTLCFSSTSTPVYQIGYSYIKDNEIKTNYFIDIHASTIYGKMEIVEIESINYINLKSIIENINCSLDYYKMEKRIKRKFLIEQALIDITKLNPYILDKILKSNIIEYYTGYFLTIS